MKRTLLGAILSLGLGLPALAAGLQPVETHPAAQSAQAGNARAIK